MKKYTLNDKEAGFVVDALVDLSNKYTKELERAKIEQLSPIEQFGLEGFKEDSKTLTGLLDKLNNTIYIEITIHKKSNKLSTNITNA